YLNSSVAVDLMSLWLISFIKPEKALKKPSKKYLNNKVNGNTVNTK
ncbi:unnamed protein product, partial [marine sediment metagenome]